MWRMSTLFRFCELVNSCICLFSISNFQFPILNFNFIFTLNIFFSMHKTDIAHGKAWKKLCTSWKKADERAQAETEAAAGQMVVLAMLQQLMTQRSHNGNVHRSTIQMRFILLYFYIYCLCVLCFFCHALKHTKKTKINKKINKKKNREEKEKEKAGIKLHKLLSA